MAGPGGQEVGRVGIRAVPLTDTFGKEILAYLERIEKTLSVEIPVIADTDGFKAETDKTKEETEKGDPVKIPVKPTADLFQQQVLADVKKAVRGIQADIPVTVEGEQFRRDLEVQVQAVEKLVKAEIPVGVEDATAFRQSVLDKVAEVDALIKAAPQPKVEVAVEVDKGRYRSFLASLEDGFARITRGGNAADDALNGNESAARRATTAVTGLIGQGTQLGGVFSGAAKYLFLWAPAVLLAGAALVAVLPSVLVLLPALAGVGALIGTIALTMGSLGKAFSPLVKGVQALSKPLGALVTSGIAPLVHSLTTGLLPVLQQGLSGFAVLINTVLKQLLKVASAGNVLTTLGVLFHGLVAAATPLGQAIAPLAVALLDLTTAAVPGLILLNQAFLAATRQFLVWVNAGTKSGALQRSITGAVQILLSFVGGVAALAKPVIAILAAFGPVAVSIFGAIGRSITGALTALVPFAQQLASNKTLLASIGKAIGTVVGFLTQLVEAIAANRTLLVVLGVGLLFLVSPIALAVAGIVALVAGFQQLSGVNTVLAPLIAGVQSFGASIGTAFAAIGPALGHFASGVLPILVSLGKNIATIVGPALASLGTTIATKVAPAMAAFIVAVTPLARLLLKIFSAVLLAAIKAIFTALQGFADVISGVLNIVAALLTGDWPRLWKGAEQVVEGFAKGVLATLQIFLASPIGQLLRLIVSEVGKLFGSIGSAIATAFRASLSGIGNLAGVVGSALAGFGAAVGGILTNSFSAVAGVVTGVVRGIGTAIGAAFSAVVAQLTAIWSGFWASTFGRLVSAAIGLEVAVVRLGLTIMVGVVLLAVGLLVAAWRAGWDTLMAIVTAVTAVVLAIVRTVFAAVRAVVTAQVKAVEAVVRVSFDAVRSVVIAVGSAVRASIIAVWGFIEPYVSSAVGRVVAAVHGIEKVASIVGDAFHSAYTGATKWIGSVVSAAAGIGGRVVHAVGDFGSLLFDAGARLIQGLINGITSRIKGITDAINSITSVIKNHLPGSPIRTGPLTSWNNGGAGKRLVDLLADGLSDTRAVDTAMNNLTNRVAVRAPSLDFTAGVAGSSPASLTIGTVIGEFPESLLKTLDRRQALADALSPVF